MLSLEFFIDIILRPHCGPGVDSACNRNKYQEFFLGGKGGQSVRLTTLPPFVSCLEIWEPQPSRTLRARRSLYRGLLYLFLTYTTAWLLFARLCFCGARNRNMAAGQFVQPFYDVGSWEYKVRNKIP